MWYIISWFQGPAGAIGPKGDDGPRGPKVCNT